MFKAAARPFAFSALHYSQTDLSNAKHTNELKRRNEIYLKLFAVERGVGNASCGPEILKQYEAKAEPVTFTYSIIPLNPDDNVGNTANKKLPVVSTPMITRDKFGILTIESASADDNIYYTLDGGEPTEKSLRYIFPFELSQAKTVKAKVINGSLHSLTSSLKTGKLKMMAPKITPQNTYFVDSIQVNISCPINDAKIYYTLDGSTPDDKSIFYTGHLTVKKNTQLKAIAYKKGFLLGNITVSGYNKVKLGFGIQYSYYVGHWEKIPNFLKLKPQKTGIIDKFSLGAIDTNKDHYALLMFTSIKIKQGGEYTFYVGSNDGTQLAIDNKQIVDNDGPHGYQIRSGKVVLKKGIHSLELRYFQAGGGQELKIFWKGPGFDKKELIIGE